MKAVGLKVLKNKLSEYVRMAQGGETILITDRDRVVAEMVPPPPEPASLSDIRLAELVRKGYLKPATHPRGGPPPSQPTMKFEDVMGELDEDRADRDVP
jgi:antitoxin (DNA-binding transcriptional repressor) of toxin-antitoxin stability system